MAIWRRDSPRRLMDLIPLAAVFANEDFALAGVVRLTDDAFLLHAFHDRSRAIIADLQAALDIARRSLAIACDNLHSLLIEVGGVTGLPHAGAVKYRIAVLVLVGLRDLFEVLGHALRLEMAHDLLDFVIRHERPMHAADAATAGHVEHVALAEQLLGALL